MQNQVKHQRDLFEIKRGGKRLTVAVRGGCGGWRRYIGSIDGQECAMAPAKGDLLRMLIDMTGSQPHS